MNDKEEILQAIQESISANMKNIREDIQKSSEEVSAKLTDFNNQISALKSDYEALKKDVEDMKAKKLEERGAAKSVVLSILKGSVYALCISLVCVLVFAFCLKFTPLSESLITPINQVIKGVSIFFGVFIGMKKHKEMGLLSGFLIGLFFTIIAFLVFSILDGAFCFDRTFLNDIIFGSIIGAICGIICVNLKKN